MDRGGWNRGRGRDGAGGGGRGGGRGRDGSGGGGGRHDQQKWSPRQGGSGEWLSNGGRGSGGGGGSHGNGRGGGQGRGGRGGGNDAYGRGGGPARVERIGGAGGYGRGGGSSTGGRGGDYGWAGGAGKSDASQGQRVESAQPVQRPPWPQPPPQISRPEPVSVMQKIKEVYTITRDGLSTSEADPLMFGSPEASDRILPIKRPDNGGTVSIRTARLRVNHFPVIFSPETTIMHYDVDVKPEVPFNKGRHVEISKSTLALIRNKLSSDDPSGFPLSMTAYDGEKNIFSAVSLPTGNFRVEVSNGEDVKGRSYIVAIKLVNELKLCKLKDYLSGQLMSIPRDILQGMDLVMKENPGRHMISVGRSFFPRESREGDDLGRGITASRGFQPRLKATSQGLAMCLDYSVLAFRKPIPVIDFLRQHVPRFDINYFQRFRREVNGVLKGLKVTVTHRKSKQKYTIGGLTEEKTRQLSFIAEDPESKNPPRQLGLVDYFREKYNKDIMYKDIPCLDLGKGNKKNHVPMEFCDLVEGQRYPKEHLDKYASKKLKNLSLVQPEVRESEICSIVRSEDGPSGGGVAHNFGIEVNPNMTIVPGRRIAPPELKLGAPNGKVIKVKVDAEKCQWNLVRKSVVEGKRIDRWGVIDFSSYDEFRLEPDYFIPQLIHKCRNLGIHMEEPLLYKPTSMSMFSTVDILRELLEEVYEVSGGNLQFLLCVMSRKDPGYKSLKWISETQLGIVTQCCLSTNELKDQLFTNLAIKINAKLGGSNVELNDPLPHFEGKGHVMFIGADVNHPGSWNTTSPSIAAVVATMNWPAANRYAARVRAQDHRTERILNFGDMCLELVQSYARVNNVRPDKIVVFRDGVSDNQFDMVLNEELLDLKKAFQTIKYHPTITLIVAQKRHQTRFFQESQSQGGSITTGNMSPGTVVDTIIVHPFEFDFYLCSHYGSIGTSKPTHYHVLRDEHGFSSDLLQKLIYNLCFTFARCTKPVSLVPPVYYADLVAYRGRLYYEAMVEEGQSPASTTHSSSASASSSVLSVESFDQNFLKLHTDLENVMFFV